MIHIEKLDNFFKNIFEALKSPVKIKWDNKGSSLGGLFNVNSNTYMIECIERHKGIWTYKFRIYDVSSNQMINSLTNNNKDVWKVLPTIESGFEYLLKLKNPECILFSALDMSSARKKLYNSFCEKISKSHNLEFKTYTSQGKQIFILFKKNIDVDHLFNSIKNIIESEFNF